MDLVYTFLILWILVAAPTKANSCISRSAVCCMVGHIEGKIFFDEIEGPGCSNSGYIQVILNLVGFPSQGYNNGIVPNYHFRLKTYGEILPACSGVGPDYGHNGGRIISVQPFEDGSIYNDTVLIPRGVSGIGTGDILGRAVAIYDDLQSSVPLACCVIGQGQPVALPTPSPTSPTPLGPQGPIDLTIGQQTKGQPTFKPSTLNQNPGISVNSIGPKDTTSNNNFYPNDNDGKNNVYPNVPSKGIGFPGNQNNGGGDKVVYPTVPSKGIGFPGNKNNDVGGNGVYPSVPSKGISFPGNKNNGGGNNIYPSAPSNGIVLPVNPNTKFNNINNNNVNNPNSIPNNSNNNDNSDNPKYILDEEELDKKFNLIGGYGGASNFDFDSYNPNGNSAVGYPSNNNNNGNYNNIYSAGNNNYNTNTDDVFGPSSPPKRGNSPFHPSSSGGNGYSFNDPNNNNNFNSFGNQNRGHGFGNSQFPSVFGSIGAGNFFNLDGKLAGAALVNGNHGDSAGLGQGGKGLLGSSLGNGFKAPKGPSFQDIYNKPVGESPLSNSGLSDSFSPKKKNSISSLFFSDPQIKQTIGLTDEDKFIPRESEEEEESTSYQSDTESTDNDSELADGGFDPDVKDGDESTGNDGVDGRITQLSPSDSDQIGQESNTGGEISDLRLGDDGVSKTPI